MKSILTCEYNEDNGYVEVLFHDLNMLRMKCEEVEVHLRMTPHSKARRVELLERNPLEYVQMALDGGLQEYCDLMDDEFKDLYGRIVKGYLKNGYNLATAKMMAREVMRCKV